MGFSVLIARHRHLPRLPLLRDAARRSPSGWRRGSPARTACCSNKYYVDELYDATVISGTMASGRGLWTFDRNVVDGAVNGSGWLTMFSVVVLGPDRQVRSWTAW